MGMQERESTG